MHPSADSDEASAAAGRRGRPASGTEGERRDRVLDAALAELVDVGADRLTMAGVARRASASKETLYRWFGDRDGLFAALIQRDADRSATRIEQALHLDGHPLTAFEFRATLVDYSAGLLRLLTGQTSVALNRAAMNDEQLRSLLLRQGRHRVGPLVGEYLKRGQAAGLLSMQSAGGAANAFELLYGLVVRDSQIRVLLGEPAPNDEHIAARAEEAVEQFLTLCATVDAGAHA